MVPLVQGNDRQWRAGKDGRLYSEGLPSRQAEAKRHAPKQLCADIAFKTKHPETCKEAATRPLGASLGPMVPSQQELFERYVMGVCGWVGVARAKELDCFPKGYKPKMMSAEELDRLRLYKALRGSGPRE